jgi:hypothetical protein
MERIRIDLDTAEYSGLVRLSEQELRPVGEQARHLIRDALKRRGLLSREIGASSTRTGSHGE